MMAESNSPIKPKRECCPNISLRLWSIPIAGCLIMLMSQGSMKANGLIFVALMQEENHGRGISSLPFSLFGAASIYVGPLVGFLGYQMSFLALTSFGLSLLMLSHLVCFFTTNIYVVTIFIGLLKSSGTILISTTIPKVIISTFKDRKATAMGITTTGIPLAGFFWPAITQAFLENYGLKGTFLLIGAVTLHALIGIIIMSFHDPWSKETKCKQLRKDLCNLQKRENNTKVGFKQKVNLSPMSKPSSSGSNCEEDIKLLDLKDSSVVIENHDKPGIQNKCIQNCNEVLATNNSLKETEVLLPVQDVPNTKPRNGAEETPKLSRKQILYDVLRNRGFYLLAITNGVNMFTQNGLNQVIVDFMLDKGFDVSSAVLLITASSSGGILGRLGMGWVADKGFVSSHVQKASSIILSASMIILSTFTNNYGTLWTSFFLMGLGQASSAVVNLVQYAYYFRSEQIIMALSLAKVIHGLFQLSRSPALGVFRDVYGSYNCIFRTMSLCMYFLAFLWLLEAYLHRKPTDCSVDDTNPPDSV